MENITYKKVNAHSLDEFVKIHIASFKDYFLTNLGEKFLYRFYREFLEDKDTVAIAAFDMDKMIGFILCTKNKTRVMGNLYQRNLGLLAGSIMMQVLKLNKVIIKGLFSRLGVIKSIVKILFSKVMDSNKRNAGSNPVENIRLLSIAVDPQYRGTGVSEGLMSYFHHSLLEENVHAVGLSVNRGNGRAIGFYNKMGWRFEREEKNSIYLTKTL